MLLESTKNLFCLQCGGRYDAGKRSNHLRLMFFSFFRSIDPGSLPQRKFPWNDELRGYLREIIQLRKNCYYIIRPRKDTLSDYVKGFLETKLKPFWPKDWITVEVLVEEGQAAPAAASTASTSSTVTTAFTAPTAGYASFGLQNYAILIQKIPHRLSGLKMAFFRNHFLHSYRK